MTRAYKDGLRQRVPMTPFPIPLTTPPETRIYFVIVDCLSGRCRSVKTGKRRVRCAQAIKRFRPGINFAVTHITCTRQT